VDDSAEVAAEVTEKTPDGGLEIGVSRSEENSNPGRFPRWSASGGNEVADEGRYMLLMYADDGGRGVFDRRDGRIVATAEGWIGRGALGNATTEERVDWRNSTPRLGSSTSTAMSRKISSSILGMLYQQRTNKNCYTIAEKTF